MCLYIYIDRWIYGYVDTTNQTFNKKPTPKPRRPSPVEV